MTKIRKLDLPRLRTAACVALALGLGLLCGCESDSGDETIRQVDIEVAGLYRNPSGGRLVSQNTGGAISQMDLRQTGDQLEGIDNNGKVFSGTIGQVIGTSATFNIDGFSTAGNAATISGTIDVSGSVGTMRGTWIEDNLYGTVYGQATVPTNAPPAQNLSISPSGSTTMTVGSTETFTVSGGDGTYTWSVSQPIGTITGSGSSVQYTALTNGTQTVTARDGSNRSASTTVTQN